jgi:hypothetical protein
MATIDKDSASLGLVVAGTLLALLFAGQVWSFAARWAGRAVSGAFLVLLALGVGYAVAQLYAGWTSAKDEEQSFDDADRWNEDPSSGDGGVDDVRSEYLEGSLSEQELEEELEELLESDTTDVDEIDRELN